MVFKGFDGLEVWEQNLGMRETPGRRWEKMEVSAKKGRAVRPLETKQSEIHLGFGKGNLGGRQEKKGPARK